MAFYLGVFKQGTLLEEQLKPGFYPSFSGINLTLKIMS